MLGVIHDWDFGKSANLLYCLSLQEIAETKLPDLNCTNVEAGMRIVEGTAKNMGITIID